MAHAPLQGEPYLLMYGAALTFFGVVFLSISRYYVELLRLRFRTGAVVARTRSAALAA